MGLDISHCKLSITGDKIFNILHTDTGFGGCGVYSKIFRKASYIQLVKDTKVKVDDFPATMKSLGLLMFHWEWVTAGFSNTLYNKLTGEFIHFPNKKIVTKKVKAFQTTADEISCFRCTLDDDFYIDYQNNEDILVLDTLEDVMYFRAYYVKKDCLELINKMISEWDETTSFLYITW